MSELKATPGPWSIYNMVNAETGKRMTPEEIGEYVANAVRARPECDDFLFISALVDGEPRDVCHIGNGEQGPYNALLMAASRDMYELLDTFPGFASSIGDKAAWAQRVIEVKRKARGEA